MFFDKLFGKQRVKQVRKNCKGKGLREIESKKYRNTTSKKLERNARKDNINHNVTLDDKRNNLNSNRNFWRRDII